MREIRRRACFFKGEIDGGLG